MNYSVPRFNVSKIQSSRVPKFQSFKVSKFPSFKVSKFRSFKASKFQSSKVSAFRSFEVSAFQSSEVPQFQTYKVSNCKISNFQTSGTHPFQKNISGSSKFANILCVENDLGLVLVLFEVLLQK